MPQFYVASHGIIRKEDKILVTKRAENNDYMPSLWDIPGGKLEPGETAEQGLIREIKEETNLEVAVKDLKFVYSNIESSPEAQYYLLIFECEYKSGDIKLNPEEHSDFKWATLEELRQMDLIHFVKSWSKTVIDKK